MGLVVRRLSRSLEPTARARGFRFTATATGLDEAGGLTHQRLHDAIAERGRSGAARPSWPRTPASHDDAERHRYQWDYAWEQELAALTDPTSRTAVEQAGFRLGTYADLPPS